MAERLLEHVDMRLAIAVIVVVAAACTGSGTDLDATDQGVCSNLSVADCRANAACQPAYVDSGFQPAPSYLHCLALEDRLTPDSVCAALDRDGCRARKDCSPVFWQELGPTDAPVGDPTYQSCDLETALATPPQ